MLIPDDIKHQRDLLNTTRRRVRVEITQRQEMAVHTPPHIIISIERGQADIATIKIWLRARGETVEDAPEDGGDEPSEQQTTANMLPDRLVATTPMASPLLPSAQSGERGKGSRETILFWIAVVGLPLALLGTIGTYLQWWFPRSSGADPAATVVVPTASSAAPVATAAPTQPPTEAPAPTVAPAPVFTLRYPFDVAQIEVDELRGDGALAATVPITDFLRLTRLEFGAIENESEPAWNVRLVVANTSNQPLALDLSNRFFALEDDQGRKAELVYFCCNSTTGEILDAGQRREIQLIFRSVDGWYGKATSAGSIYLRVTGFSPLARASWRFPTLATAD